MGVGWIGAMDIYQCPVCELRFRNAPELEGHIRSDHPKFQAEASELDDIVAEAHRRRHERIKVYRPDEDD